MGEVGSLGGLPRFVWWSGRMRGRGCGDGIGGGEDWDG